MARLAATAVVLVALAAAIAGGPAALARPSSDDGATTDAVVTRAGAVDSTAPPESIVVVLPVRRSPLLTLLRSSAPLAVAVALPASAREGWGDVPPDAETLLRRDPMDGGAGTRVGAASVSGGTIAADGGDHVTVSGSKSFSVDFNRGRDANLSQGLDLSIHGRIAGDVDLSATLSDRALPFEPDGTTRELDDLDNLSLAVRAPGGEATLGDFRLEAFPGEFARVSRELQGVRGGANVRGTRWDVTAASAKGQRRNAEFRGEEGKQGPYVLQSRGAQTGGEGGIVSGSETVWLDGAKLRRGSDADYVMDYAAGTITFTVRRPVGSASRIAVDYEAASSSYKRQLYAAGTRGGSARAGWFAAFLREGDDWKNPYGADLTSDDRHALASAGDSTNDPLPSGVRYVGPGQGSYAWDESNPAAPRWVYLGPGFGDTEVEFASVGTGKGAYADTTTSAGVTFYHYRGPTLGSFSPGRQLVVPAAASLVDAGGTLRLGTALSLDGEFARSSLDRNLLSDRDDGDNGGTAARAALRLDPRALRFFGRHAGAVKADVSFRSRDESFTSFDRLDPAFESERWNQRAGALGERRFEAALQYDATRGAQSAATVRGEWGQRRLADGSRSTRRAAEGVVRGFVVGSARWDEARNLGDAGAGLRSVVTLDLAREHGLIQPRLRAGRERVTGTAGDSLAPRSARYASSAVVVAPSSAVRFRGGVTWRRDEDADASVTAGEATRVLRSTAIDGGATVRADAVTVDASLARRRAFGGTSGGAGAGTTGGTTGATSNTDLAQVVVTGGKPGGLLTSEVRWDVSQVREPERQRSLVPVGPGLGSYDAAGALSPGGGYEFVSVVGPEATRTRATWQMRVDAYPARRATKPGAPRALWRSLGASTLLRLDSQSRLALGRFERAFRFGDYLDPASTLRGDWSGRQTLEFVPPGGVYDARAEAGVHREVVGDLQNLRVRKESRDATLRTRHGLPLRFRLAERVTMDRSRYDSERTDAPDRTTSRLRGRGAELELSRAAGPQVNLAWIGRYRHDHDVLAGGSQATWSSGPSVRCAAAGRLRLDARALWGRTDQRGSYTPPGSVVAPVLGPRLDYDLLSEWTIRDRLQLSLTWNGATIPGRAATYNARLELRSSF